MVISPGSCRVFAAELLGDPGMDGTDLEPSSHWLGAGAALIGCGGGHVERAHDSVSVAMP